MSLQLEVIRAAEFVRVGAHGEFDLPASQNALAMLATACLKRGVERAVLDLRKVQIGTRPAFTTADLLELLNTFPHVGFSKRFRLAILYTCDPHKRARLFAFLSTLHGWSVSAFGDFEHALLWLSQEARPSLHVDQPSRGTSIPIRCHAASGRSPHRHARVNRLAST